MASQANLDRAPIAPAGALGGVPIIDLSNPHGLVVTEIARACAEWGFFQIVGHEVPVGDLERVIATARAYFSQPREVKRAQLRSHDNPWGYYDRELTKEQRDRKEVFDIGPDAGAMPIADGGPFEGATPWPGVPAPFEQVMREWYGRMELLSDRLTALIGDGLGDSGRELHNAFTPAHTSYLRLNYYPAGDPLAAEMGAEADFGIHHHTDAGALTVLLQDGVSGLQVFRDGQWHDVAPTPDAFTINIGDMMQVWSNDHYQAPQHRVLAMDTSERISIPYFYNPAYSADVRPLVEPAHYHPLNWGEFRRRRADGDFANYGAEVQISEWRIAQTDSAP